MNKFTKYKLILKNCHENVNSKKKEVIFSFIFDVKGQNGRRDSLLEKIDPLVSILKVHFLVISDSS